MKVDQMATLIDIIRNSPKPRKTVQRKKPMKPTNLFNVVEMVLHQPPLPQFPEWRKRIVKKNLTAFQAKLECDKLNVQKPYGSILHTYVYEMVMN